MLQKTHRVFGDAMRVAFRRAVGSLGLAKRWAPLLVTLGCFGSMPGAAQERAGWAGAFQNLTANQALTLLALAHDYFPDEQLEDSQYMRCIEPYDARAAKPEAKQRIDETLIVVDGAVRRMGYADYASITDDYERLRLAKMIGEGMWMRQFRAELEDCLGMPPGTTKKH